jgi:hypothetical protein
VSSRAAAEDLMTVRASALRKFPASRVVRQRLTVAHTLYDRLLAVIRTPGVVLG